MLSRILIIFGFFAVSIADLNTPPILSLQREWKLLENESVGSRIETARGQDMEEDTLEFSIKPINNGRYADGSKLFRIDSQSGAIFLNESLKGKAGQKYNLYVTAYDGEYESKTEVFIEIQSPGDKLNPKRPPSIFGGIPRPEVGSYPRPPIGKIPSYQFPSLTTERVHLPSNVKTQTTSRTSPWSHVPTTVSSTESNEDNSENILPTYDGSSLLLNGSDNELVPMPNVSETNETITIGPTIAAAVAPIVALVGLVPLVAVGLWLARRSRDNKNSSGSKDDKKRVFTEPVIAASTLPESEFVTSSLTRAQSNKYEATEWDSVDRNPEIQSVQIAIDSKWEYPRHHLKIFGILGEGCFGQVWRGEARDIGEAAGVSVVAVKTLKENAGEREKRDLLSELEVMKMLDPHPNIVRLLGCCTEKEPLFVIMEYVQLGKLQTYLRSSRADRYYGNLHGGSKHLSSRDLTTFAYHVARGMEYLSSRKIIHRDLAARNVLVGTDNTCKVADFGFARDVVANRVYERKSEGRLPIRWMAPESLYDNIFSSKTDVWSFGILLWEIVTLGSTPYPGMSASEVIKKIRDGYRLEKPDHCKRELYNIMYYCWDKDQEDRPSFSELSQTLESLLLEDVDYIELEHFPEHAYYNMLTLSGEKV